MNYKKNLNKLNGKIGLLTTAQHIHQINLVKEYLKKKGFDVIIGKPQGRTRFSGHVLGCSFAPARTISEQIDMFAFIGSGIFHPLGVALATKKKIVSFDMETGIIHDIDKLRDRILRQRFAQITRTIDAKTFGILIGFSGILYLFSDNLLIDDNNFLSALLILLGSTCYVIGGVLTLKISKKKNVTGYFVEKI